MGEYLEGVQAWREEGLCGGGGEDQGYACGDVVSTFAIRRFGVLMSFSPPVCYCDNPCAWVEAPQPNPGCGCDVVAEFNCRG